LNMILHFENVCKYTQGDSDKLCSISMPVDFYRHLLGTKSSL